MKSQMSKLGKLSNAKVFVLIFIGNLRGED